MDTLKTMITMPLVATFLINLGDSMSNYFSELEADVLDMYCAEVPVNKIAEEFDISVELVERIGRKWERENNKTLSFS